MAKKPSYDDLVTQVTALQRETLHLKESEDIFHRQNASLKALHKTSLGLIDKLGQEELLEKILEHSASLSGTIHGYIYLLLPGENELQIKVGMGFMKSQVGRKVVLGQGIGGQVWQTASPLVVEDYQSWPGRIADQVLNDLRSIVGIPLKYNDRVLGVIGLAHVDNGKQFSEEDITTLEQFAALALLALEKSRLYSDVRHELTERKRTEGILKESEKRYRNLLESSPDPIVVYDMEGMPTYVNPAFKQIFHFSKEELLKKPMAFVPPESKKDSETAVQQMLNGSEVNLLETKRVTKEGNVLDVQLNSTVHHDDSGRPLGNIVTLRDISARRKAEDELARHREHLEELVTERTRELARTNTKLEQEIEDRRRAEKALRKREIELQGQSHRLEEVNTALRVLLKQRQDDKKELNETVLRNMQDLITPYLQKVLNGHLSNQQRTLLRILEANLNNIVSPFIDKLTSGLAHLTPTEIRVASLVKEGKTNKEIAEILLVSKNTILFHRHNIRDKLGLKNKKINLRSHLLAMEQ